MRKQGGKGAGGKVNPEARAPVPGLMQISKFPMNRKGVQRLTAGHRA